MSSKELNRHICGNTFFNIFLLAFIQSPCQVWHWCLPSGHVYSFVCPVGTVFNQKVRVCDWWFNVHCPSSVELYGNNAELYRDANGNNIWGEASASGKKPISIPTKKIISTKASPPDADKAAYITSSIISTTDVSIPPSAPAIQRSRKKRKQRTHQYPKCKSGVCSTDSNHLDNNQPMVLNLNGSKNTENFSQHWFTSNGHTLGVGIDSPTESYFPNAVEISTVTTNSSNALEDITKTVEILTTSAPAVISITSGPTAMSKPFASTTRSPRIQKTLENLTNAHPSKRRKLVKRRQRKRPFRSRKLASLPQSKKLKFKNKYNIDYDNDMKLEEEYEIIHKTE